MAKCINCSAPLPPNSIVCEYCGSRNDTDLKGIHTYTTHEPESQRICPRCNIPLKTIDLKINGKFLIERCNECLGLFFDSGELETLLKVSVKNVYDINHARLNNINDTFRREDYKVSYIKCPVCSDIMNRVRFGYKSGVIVDKCNEHGIWLDAGELRHLFEWMKAGGSLLHDQREVEKKQEEVQEKLKNEQLKNMDWNNFSFSDINKEPDIIDIFKRVVSWFTDKN